VREVIGVYDHPPPAGSGPIQGRQMRDTFGSASAAAKVTRARDWTSRHIDELSDWLW
jgi:hypothetical protein